MLYSIVFVCYINSLIFISHHFYNVYPLRIEHWGTLFTNMFVPLLVLVDCGVHVYYNHILWFIKCVCGLSICDAWYVCVGFSSCCVSGIEFDCWVCYPLMCVFVCICMTAFIARECYLFVKCGCCEWGNIYCTHSMLCIWVYEMMVCSVEELLWHRQLGMVVCPWWSISSKWVLIWIWQIM